jgi:hypothetical protein
MIISSKEAHEPAYVFVGIHGSPLWAEGSVAPRQSGERDRALGLRSHIDSESGGETEGKGPRDCHVTPELSKGRQEYGLHGAEEKVRL